LESCALAEALLGSEDAGGWNRFGYPCFLMLGFVVAARPALGTRLSSHWIRLAVAGGLGFVVLAASGAALHDRWETRSCPVARPTPFCGEAARRLSAGRWCWRSWD
jgi:hypothetical protein